MLDLSVAHCVSEKSNGVRGRRIAGLLIAELPKADMAGGGMGEDGGVAGVERSWLAMAGVVPYRLHGLCHEQAMAPVRSGWLGCLAAWLQRQFGPFRFPWRAVPDPAYIWVPMDKGERPQARTRNLMGLIFTQHAPLVLAQPSFPSQRSPHPPVLLLLPTSVRTLRVKGRSQPSEKADRLLA